MATPLPWKESSYISPEKGHSQATQGHSGVSGLGQEAEWEGERRGLARSLHWVCTGKAGQSKQFGIGWWEEYMWDWGLRGALQLPCAWTWGD